MISLLFRSLRRALACPSAAAFLLVLLAHPVAAEKSVAASEGVSADAPDAEHHSPFDTELDAASDSLASLEVVASAPAEERAVLRAEGELVLIRPGDPLPGIAGSEVESIEPERIVARLDAFRQAWISTRGDGRVRVLDLRAPQRPSAAGPLWIVPRPAGSSEEPKGDGR